jgi:hypothetical protein
MFSHGEEAITRESVTLGEAHYLDGTSVHIVRTHPDYTCEVRFPGGEEHHMLPEDLARVPPNLPDGRDDLERALDSSRRRRGVWELPDDLRWELEAAISGLGYNFTDWNGHFKHGAYWTEGRFYDKPEKVMDRMLNHLFMFPRCIRSEDQAKILIDAIKSGTTLSEPIPIGSEFNFGCPYCGAEPVIACTGTGFVLVGEPCPRPEGLDVTEWELNVPSGSIVIANDLRNWFPCDKDYDINKVHGTHAQQLAYADVGMAHGFVGNTCPGVYRLPDDTYIISNPPYDDEESAEDRKQWEEATGAVEVGGVCTDLWWYSIVDLDELRRHFEHYTPDGDLEGFLGGHYVHTVEVKPGVYRFRHFNARSKGAGFGEERYTEIEWVREPDPLVDHIQIDADKEIPAELALAQHARDWPTLYLPDGKSNLHGCTEEERAQAQAALAGHLLCTIGNGIDWHPKGFPRTIVAPDTEPTEILPFRFQRNWYPMTEDFSTLATAAGVGSGTYADAGEFNLHPSFVLLALNVCQSLVSFGTVPSKDSRTRKYYIDNARKEMHLAARCYRALRKKHPDLVFDPDFDDWMQDHERAKAWIDNFDLGPEEAPPPDPDGLAARLQRQLAELEE